MIKVGSDFSGVGAFNQALMRLGVNYKEVFACDMDKYARQTFIHNYGEPEYYPTNVYDREIPAEPLDIYMTSPPCQAFSLAGKRLGKEDKRGILFFNSHEFIKVNKPRFFIFENVKGLLSDDGGNTFNEWVNMLGGKSVNGEPVLFACDDSVPYHLYWKVLNAKNHGVPQNRERVFLIGIRDDKDNTFRWPIEEYLSKRLKDVLEDDVDDKYYLSQNMINYFLTNTGKQKEKNNGFKFLPNSTTRRGRVGKQVAQTLDTACNQGVLIAAIRGRETENGLQQHLELGSEETSNSITTVQKDNVLVYNIKHLNETLEKHELPKDKVVIIDSYNKSIHEDVSPTISTRINASNNTHLSIPTIDNKITIIQLNLSKESGGKQPYQQNRVYDSNGLCPALNAGQVTWGGNIITTPYDYRIRRLTPRECFRLMDFPDTFTWPVSDSQAYKQAGNSIVVNVLYKILKNLPL